MMKPSEEENGVAAPVDRIVRQDVAEKLNEYLSVEDRLKRIERWIDREEEWHDKLDARSASDRVPEGRPAPFMIQDLMGQVGCQDPGQVIKIGDTPSDLHEGTNAGCGLVIGVTYGTHTRERLQPHPHTHLVDSVEELHTLLLMMLASSLLDL